MMRTVFAALSLCLFAFILSIGAAPAHAGNVIAHISGKSAWVSAVAQSHFQCLVDKLETVGYRISFMTGYAPRGNASAHPTGNALDINQTGFGRVTQRFPFGVDAIVESCGLYAGSHFGDYGHFEMPNKYGYVNVRWHYASTYQRSPPRMHVVRRTW